jgi:hypothetical protein
MSEQSSPGGVTPEAGQAVQGELRPIWPAPPTPARVSGWRWGFAARVAATVGALLFFVAAWVPWAVALTSGDLRHGPTGPQYRYYMAPAELGAPPIASFTGDAASAFISWSLLTALGALLTPLLWQRTRPWLMWLGAALYALWAALSASVLVQTSVLFFQTIPALSHAANGPYAATVQPSGARLAFYSATPTYGVYMTAAALVIALVALLMAVIALFTSPPSFRIRPATVHGEVAQSTPAGVSPARRSLPGAGAVSGGLLLWLWGFFLLPWATLNCAQSPLLSGQCQGLPVASALEAGMLRTSAYFDPAAAPWAVSGLLLLGAALALMGVWAREITRTLCAWLSGWLVFAIACALVAINGAQLVVHNPTTIGMPAGDWRGSLGTLIVFLGLLLVLIGLAPLWALAIRSAPRRDPPTT